MWLIPVSPPVAAPARARRWWRSPSGGSSSLVLVIAVAAIASGGAAVALGIAGGSGPKAHSASPPHVATKAAHHKLVPVVIPEAPAPITIPPATTTTESIDTNAPSGPKPSTWRSYVVPAVAPLVNSAPSNITDPSVIATATVHSIPLYATPGAPAPVSTLANPNYLGATVTLLVTGYQPGWVQAYIPVRPNETTRWIPSADVTTSFVTDHIVVSLSARKLTLYHDNAPVFTTVFMITGLIELGVMVLSAVVVVAALIVMICAWIYSRFTEE